MDYDEFSKDDFIGATAVNLYELLIAHSGSLTVRRLLDDMVTFDLLMVTSICSMSISLMWKQQLVVGRQMGSVCYCGVFV